MKTRAWTKVRTVVAILLLAWLLAAVDMKQIADALRNLQPAWLALGFLAHVAAASIAIARTYVIFGHTGLTNVEIIRITFGGYFFNQILPTGLGGDAYRSVHFKPHTGHWTSAIGGILLERIVGATSLLLPAIAISLFGDRSRAVLLDSVQRVPASLGVSLVIAMIAATVALLLMRRMRNRMRSSLMVLRDSARTLGIRGITGVFALSAAHHGFRVAGAAAFLWASRQTVPWTGLIVSMGITLLSSLVPISTGALGVREAVFSHVLRLYGVPLPTALTVALLQRAIVILFAVAGGLCLLRRKA